MGSQDAKEQESNHEKYWVQLTKNIGEESGSTIDAFFADFLRWQTGQPVTVSRVYSMLKDWWLSDEQKGGNADRLAVATLLLDASNLYANILGTERHKCDSIAHILVTLLDMGINTHRPFTIRILDDLDNERISLTQAEDTLKLVTIWIVRRWLRGGTTSNLRDVFTTFATKQVDNKSYSSEWEEMIRARQFSTTGMPDRDELLQGMLTTGRIASGKTTSAKRFLWEINTHISKDSNPQLDTLTLEHIMPRTLTNEWRDHLGGNAAENHEKFAETLANATLVGGRLNTSLSNAKFADKREKYINSNVELTRQLIQYQTWQVRDVRDRAEQITSYVIERWPWDYGATRPAKSWRKSGGVWHYEKSYNDMLLSVASVLLDGTNGKLPSDWGDLKPRNIIHKSGAEPSKNSRKYQVVPGHEQYVILVNRSGTDAAQWCRKMGELFGEIIDARCEQIKST